MKPDQSKLAIGTRYADQIEIYEPDGTLIKQISGSLNSVPVYEVHSVGDKPVMSINRDKTHFGYIHIAVTNDFIYALYSGRLPLEYPGRANFGECVHIYDWNGELVRIYKLGNDIIKIRTPIRLHLDQPNLAKIETIQIFPFDYHLIICIL